MNTPESLNGMVSDLIRRGLPVDYAERAAAEFADHHRDLVEELQAAGWSQSQALTEASLRLGDSRTLVKKTAREYQRRYWCARWPLLTFLIAPIPAYIAAYIVMGYSILLIVYCLTKLGLTASSDPDVSFNMLPLLVKYVVLAGFTMVLPAIVLSGFNRLARRAAVGGRWVLVAALVLGMFIGMFRWQRVAPHLPLFARNPQTGKAWPDHQPVDFFIMVPNVPDYWSLSGMCRWYMMPKQLGQLLLPTVAAVTLLTFRRRLAIRAGRQFVPSC